MVTQTVESRPQVAEAVPYCTETRFRNLTGYTAQLDLPSDVLKRMLLEATEQVKRDAFLLQREELITKDDEGRYFPAFKYLANKFGRSSNTGKLTSEDLTVYEIETATTLGTFRYAATRQRRILHNISHAIDDVDGFNNYFTLQSGYPTNSRQIVLTYCYVGKPLSELVGYEKPLERACVEMTNIMFLRRLKDKRLKKGSTTLTIGGQSVTRDENAANELINSHYRRYHEIVNWMKPFRGRSFTIGRGDLSYYRNRKGLRGLPRYN